MSKQNTGKRVDGERRANGTRGNAPGTPQMADRASTSTGSKPARTGQQMSEKRVGGSSSGGGGGQARPRPRAIAAPPKKSGMPIRPFDLALVAVGLAVVGLIVWSSLGSSNSQNVAQVPQAQGTTAPTGPTATFDPTLPKPLDIGTVAPDFSLPAPDGKTYTLSQFKGKVVLLELFAPWCPHCQDDAPLINQVYERYKDKDVQVLAVSGSPWGYKLDEQRAAQQTPTPISMDDIIWFRDTFKVPFPILLDKEVVAAEQYKLAFYPTIYIIGKDGKIVSQPAGRYVFENGKPVSQREEDLSVEFLSRKIDEALK